MEAFPYIEAEVRYAVQEYARTVVDVLAVRTRLAFLSAQSAEDAISRIAEIMAKELKWTQAKKQVILLSYIYYRSARFDHVRAKALLVSRPSL